MMKTQSLRMTKQRRVILEELRKVRSHPSADKIYEKVKKRLPRISLGTVYRNLEILTRIGEIQHVEIHGTVRRFDGNPSNHYHVHCIHCDRIEDIDIGRLTQIEAAIESLSDYKITGHRLELIGVCQKCSEKINGGNHPTTPVPT